MSKVLARLVDQRGRLLLPPNPSYQYLIDGKPIRTYDLDKIEDLALTMIEQNEKEEQERSKPRIAVTEAYVKE